MITKALTPAKEQALMGKINRVEKERQASYSYKRIIPKIFYPYNG
jgi:hypothetical protein